MSKTAEQFFYEIIGEITHPNSLNTQQITTVKQLVGRYWMLFHTQYLNIGSTLNMERTPGFKEAICDLILQSLQSDAGLHQKALLVIENVNAGPVSAPTEMRMSREVKTDNSGEDENNSYQNRLNDFFVKTLGINVAVNLDDDLELGNSKDSSMPVATATPISAITSRNQDRDPAPEASKYDSASPESSVYSANNDSCCSDPGCTCFLCCPNTGYGYYVPDSRNDYGYGYGDTIVCCNGINCNDCTHCITACGHCVSNGCCDVVAGLGNCLEGLQNCCVGDICKPACTTIEQCQCPDCQCPDCQCPDVDCEDDSAKGCIGVICAPCICISGLISKLSGTKHATTPSPSAAPSPSSVHHLRQLATSTATKFDPLTATLNQAAGFIDAKLQLNKVGLECAGKMSGGAKTTASTSCCVVAAVCMLPHLMRRCIDVKRLCCDRPDPVERGHLNRNVAALCCISACCAAGLIIPNPIHGYHTATFLASLGTWFCNRVDIALAEDENLLGCKSKNGILGYHDPSGKIAKLKKLMTNDISHDHWLEEVSSILTQNTSPKTDMRISIIEQRINERKQRLDHAKNDAYCRSIPVRVSEFFCRTTDSSREGCCSTSQLLSGCITFVNCKKEETTESSVTTRLTSSNDMWKLPVKTLCCGVGKPAPKVHTV